MGKRSAESPVIFLEFFLQIFHILKIIEWSEKQAVPVSENQEIYLLHCTSYILATSEPIFSSSLQRY